MEKLDTGSFDVRVGYVRFRFKSENLHGESIRHTK